MTPFGIRSGNDIGPLDGEYIVDSVRLANEQAPEGFRFYFVSRTCPIVSSTGSIA